MSINHSENRRDIKITNIAAEKSHNILFVAREHKKQLRSAALEAPDTSTLLHFRALIKLESTCSCTIRYNFGGHPIGLLAGCLTGRDPSGQRLLGNWIYRGVVTAELVIVTCSSLDGTGMAFSVTAIGKLKAPLHIGKPALDTT